MIMMIMMMMMRWDEFLHEEVDDYSKNKHKVEWNGILLIRWKKE